MTTAVRCPDCGLGSIPIHDRCSSCGLAWEDLELAAAILPGLEREQRQARARQRALRNEWPLHQPECFDAPIPGRVWYGGCEPGARVNPATGVCDSCGESACRVCGKENCPDGCTEP